VLVSLAQSVFQNNANLLNDYSTEDKWRLAAIDADIMKGEVFAFREGDVTIARKNERPGGSVPKIFAFSWRTKSHMVLNVTDPIEFLED